MFSHDQWFISRELYNQSIYDRAISFILTLQRELNRQLPNLLITPILNEAKMRNSFFIAGAIVALMASGALAQNQNPPAASGPQNPAISGSTSKQVEAPVKGRNSFTEGEAKSRIEKDGLSSVSSLAKDDNGVWRGKAMKDGRQVDVSLDYQGNVVVAR